MFQPLIARSQSRFGTSLSSHSLLRGILSAFGLSALLITLAFSRVPVAHAATSTVYDWAWEQPTAQGNDFTGVHCLSETLCKATVVTGDILSWDGTRWNADVSGTTTQLNGVFCATTTLCRAVGNDGIIRTWDGSIWSAESSGTTEALLGVACPSTTLCKAVGTNGTLLTWNGTAWSVESSGTTQDLHSVACPLTTYCKAVGNGGTVLSWDGAVWGSDTSGTTEKLWTVTCVSDVFCKAGSDWYSILSWDGTAWTSETLFGNGWWTGISCSSTTFCRAVGWFYRSWGGSSWSSFPVSCSQCPPRLYTAISCVPTTNYCKWVGQYGTIVSSKPGSGMKTESRGEESFDGGAGVTCPSTTLCKAVYEWPSNARSWDGTTWSIEFMAGNNTVNDIACPTTTLCKAVGFSSGYTSEPARIDSWDGLSWTEEVADNGFKLNDVACPSATVCKAVGVSGAIRSWNGAAWTNEASGTLNNLWGVKCLSETFCKAGGDNGTILFWNGTSWSAENSGVTVRLGEVYCTNSTFCKAVGDNGTILRWDGTNWSAESSGTTAFLSGVACPTTTFCRVAGSGGTILAWDGTSWSAETSGTSNDLMDVDCLSATFCKIAGDYGTILTMVVQTLNDVSAGFALHVFNGNGCLTGITVTEYQTDAPNATPDLQNGRYWNITPSGCTTGFGATVTLPTTFAPDSSAAACRYNGSAWDCANNGVATSPNTITRAGVTEFSDWATGTSTPTAVDVSAFSGRANKNHAVVLKWQTSTETRIAGFNVYRKTRKGKWRQVNGKFLQAKHAGDLAGANYRFADKKVLHGKVYRYKIQVMYLDGHSAYSNIVTIGVTR